ncbi:MAG: hypothetical protein EPO68_13965 [Planctomycetota bacterium]|nr:MAG: hypothetical protein EPO68_13965 [Planctomycetota bacterium]
MHPRTALTLAPPVLLSSTLVAQKTMTVSKPTQDGTETISVTIKDGTKPSEDFTVTVEIKKKTGAKDTTKEQKATAIAEALDADARLKAKATGDKIKVEAEGATVKLRTLSKTNNSAEAVDKVTAAMAEGPQEFEMSCVALDADLVGVDGDGAASALRVGTARGTVEVLFADVAGVEEAVSLAAEGLTQLGVPVTMSDTGAFSFPIDAELDQYMLYGCTEPNAAQSNALANLDD